MAGPTNENSVERSQRLRAYIFLAAIAGLVLALDQWSKVLVRSQLQLGELWMPLDWLAAYARVINWNNTGAAFGLLPSAGLIFSVVAVCVSAAIIYYFPSVPETQVAVRVALALQLGGAIGNLIDRVLLGTVTDFISVGTFPVFNVADASISVGVALLLAAMWVQGRGHKEEDGAAGGAGGRSGQEAGEA
jgi:signal peptidase II